MSEQETSTNKGMPKKVISILIALLLVSGIGVGAYFLLGGSSDKAKYFEAEVETFSFIEETVKERFDLELGWLEVTENNPTESKIDVSATFNDPGFFGYGMGFDIEDIINNSTISVVSQQDMKEKEATANVNAEIAGLKFEDFNAALTDEFFLLDLPFLNDTLKVADVDLGNVLQTLDPYSFDEEDFSMDFSQFFDEYTFFTEEDKKHFKKEYGELIYKEISDDAFASAKESFEVDGQTVKAEKIELTLGNEDLQKIVKSIMEQMQSDDYLKEWLMQQFERSFVPQDEIDDMMAEFDEALADAIEEMEDPESEVEIDVKSTIWVDKGLIVKRDFEMNVIDEYDDETTAKFTGTQLLEKATQTFDYDFTGESEYSEESFNVSGTLNNKDGKINDSIVLDVDDTKLTYESEETVSNNEREFTRTFGIKDDWNDASFVWVGDATYEKDQMNGNHQFFVEMEDFGQDLFTLHVGVEGQTIKSVDMLDDADSVDIGKMSEAELYDYIENDIQPQFMEWYIELFGGMNDMLY